MPWAVGEAEENGAFGCVRSEDLVENGLEEENAESVKNTNGRQ